ncbi:probable inactive receptor kinase At2g26730 [Euphorbia lathyris]|uniref:probable inactive receptor kinase At2g26730 n=1 Tax=Euphorbia lathyris TaxID=212925 RepID=UPI003313E658
MLSRAFAAKPRWSPRHNDQDQMNSWKSGSILEYSDDCLVGFVDDLPIIFSGSDQPAENRLTLREVLRASVGVIGESQLGMTEKVVLLEGKIYAVKRLRKVTVRRREFGKRIQRLCVVAEKCDYLVPIDAFLYSKRIKFILSDYYPMGSLADLLAGGRELGHTALNWKQRLTIAQDIAYAIAYIHTQCPSYERNIQMNIHGNIKASNVMINIDFTARLSDYGIIHLAEPDELSSTDALKPCRPMSEFSQKIDIYDFGGILLDILGGLGVAKCSIKWIIERKDKIRKGEIEFFEFPLEGKERQQALKVLDVALVCRNKVVEDRPCIEGILKCFGDVIKK